MTSMVIIQSFLRARLFFDRQPRELFKKGQYVTFRSSDPSIIKFLEGIGLRAVLPVLISKERRDEFLRDYLKILDELAGQNGQDLQWWATDISSKNRFTSPLPGLLTTFVRCLGAVEDMKEQERLMVLVQPPWPVVCALEDSAKESGLNFRVLSWPWSRFLARWQGKAKTFVATFKGCLGSILQIWETRRYFGRSVGNRVGQRPVYLIKSFVYPGSFSEDNHYQDPFFGGLSEFLSGNLNDKIDILTVAVSAGKRDECLRKMRCSKGSLVVPLEVFLCWGDILKGFQELFLGRLSRRFCIRGKVSFFGHNVTPLLNECLVSGGLKIPFYQYLHLAAGLRIADMVKPFSCALTFEGNPWERMFIAGLRRANSQLPIFGYQHSVVPQSAAGVFIGPREQEKSPLPTCVLTTGEIPARIIRDYGVLSEDTVEPACALRYEYLCDIDYHEKAETQERFLVLVALEGVWGVLPLLEYALGQAHNCPNILFRIRAHPVLPLSKLMNKLGRRIKSGGNIEVSLGGTVAGDVEDSSAVLYWGTTVALEALMMGKPLIHFDRGDFLSYDPLFEFDDFKWTVRKSQDLCSVLDEIRSLSEEESAVLKEKGRNYIRAYFHEVDDRAMGKFVAEPL